jgi:type VI secretion system secreted protein VgrG
VDNNRSEEVGADHKEQIGKDRNLTIKGKEAKEVGKSLSLTVKGDVIEVFKAKHSEQTTGDYYLKGQNVIIEGLQNITLSVGGSYIAIEMGTIEINTSGQLKIDGTQVQVNGKAQTSIQGGAMTEIKGGIVKIN